MPAVLVPVLFTVALSCATWSSRSDHRRKWCQTACKPGSVRRRMPPRDDHSSGTRIAACLARPTRTTRRKSLRPRARTPTPAVPIRSCSRWGLPCRRRCRKRGALLPHRFALARNLATREEPSGRAGGLFSVALSLGSPPPAVSRHRSPVEPGLSSTGRSVNPGATATVQPSGGPNLTGENPGVKPAPGWDQAARCRVSGWSTGWSSR